MRVIFTNFGTRGDFQPLCALAQHARDQGHTPLFIVPKYAAPIIEQFGLDFTSITGDLSELRDRVNQSWMSDEDSYLDTGKLWDLVSPFKQYLSSAFRELLIACRGADLLISGPAQPLGRIVHEFSGIPFVSAQFSHFGGTGGPALDEVGRQLINPFRRELGLAEIAHPLTSGANSPQLALYAMSQHLLPRSDHWPPHFHRTGFWFTSERVDINPALRQFTEEGPMSLVAVTFGSMTAVTNATLDDLVLNACKRSGARAVLQGGGIPGRLNDRVFRINYIPHRWLFRHASCVVLHGGAGTAASVFQSGKPGVFVPHGRIYDQTYWAELAHKSGCASAAIPVSELNADKLAAAIRDTIENVSIRDNAAQLGRKIRMEHGVRKAWKLVDDLVSRIGLGA
jgi:UDP:flavonoid glycosyltransferase YjiC (YdhE family)